jgi:hypothetical protein
VSASVSEGVHFISCSNRREERRRRLGRGGMGPHADAGDCRLETAGRFCVGFPAIFPYQSLPRPRPPCTDLTVTRLCLSLLLVPTQPVRLGKWLHPLGSGVSVTVLAL